MTVCWNKFMALCDWDNNFSEKTQLPKPEKIKT